LDPLCRKKKKEDDENWKLNSQAIGVLKKTEAVSNALDTGCRKFSPKS
jgi:hypothetical protein